MARASMLAVMAGMSLNAQMAQAVSDPYVIGTNTGNCNVHISSETVGQDGSGRSVHVPLGESLGNGTTNALNIAFSTLSGSVNNDGLIFFGGLGNCDDNGFGFAAVSVFDSDVRGGIVNNNSITSSASAINIQFSDLGVSVNSPDTVVFENNGTISGDTLGVGFQSATIYGTITNNDLIQSQTGAALEFNSSSVLGNLINNGIVQSAGTDAIRISDTTVNGELFNSEFGQIHGGSEGSGIAVIGASSSVVGGIVNFGLIDGNRGIVIGGSQFTGSIQNGEAISGFSVLLTNGVIEGVEDGIAVYAEDFAGSIGNESLGRITGENGYGILVSNDSSSSSFNGNITNAIDGLIEGASGGVKVFTEDFNGNFDNDGTVQIIPSELITAASSNAAAVLFDVGELNGSVTNTGLIDGRFFSGASGLRILASGAVTGGIDNEGQILGDLHGAVVSAQTLENGFENHSFAEIRGNNGDGVIIDVFAGKSASLSAGTFSGGFLNDSNAVIAGEGAGGNGVSLYADLFDGNFVNHGSITGDTSSGIGVQIGNLGLESLSHTGMNWQGDYTNTSVITGGAAGTVISLDTWTGSVSNSGTYSGQLGVGVSADTWNGNFTNESGGVVTGTLYRGVDIEAGDWTGNFVNHGTINGGVSINGLVAALWVPCACIGFNDGGGSQSIPTFLPEAPGGLNWDGDFTNTATINDGVQIDADIWTGNFTNALNATIGNSGSAALIIGGGLELEVPYALIDWTGNFTNDGTISTADAGGGQISVNTFSGSFANSGTINGGGSASAGLAIYADLWTGNFTNEAGGSITGGLDGFTFEASTASGTFTNFGNISGGGTDTGWHFSAGSHTGDLINAVGGTLSAASNAWRVSVDDLDGNVRNHGAVTATDPTGVAVLLEGYTSPGGVYTGEFQNTGTITGGASGVGLRVLADIEGEVRNSGTISGGIAVDFSSAASGLTFTQTGAGADVIGEMRLNNFYTDDIIFEDGSLHGAIFGGEDGDDTVRVNAGPSDTFAFTYDVNNIGSFSAQGGTTLLGAMAAGVDGPGMSMTTAALTVNSGATLYLDDDTVVDTHGLDLLNGSTLTYFLTQNVNQHGIINVTLGEGFDLALNGEANLDGTIRAFLNDYPAFATSGLGSYLYDGVINYEPGMSNGSFDVAAYAGSVPLGFQYSVSAIVGTSGADILLLRTAFDELIDDPTANQAAIGGALEDACEGAPAGSALAEACAYIGFLSEDDVPPFYDDLNGNMHAQNQGLPFELGELLTQSITDRIQYGFSDGGCQVSGDSWCTRQYAALDNATVSDVRSAGDDPFGWLRSGTRQVGRTAAWGRYVGSWGENDGDANGRGTQAQTHGAALGFDHVVAENLLFGVAGLYSETSTDFETAPRDEADIETVQAGAYFSWGDSKLYLNGNATYIWHGFDTVREFIVGPDTIRALGDYDGSAFSAYGEVGQVIESEGFRLQPVISLSFIDSQTDGFSETGGDGLDLIVEESDTQSLRSSVGARFSYPFAWGQTRLVPEIRAAWRHEFLDVRQEFTASFSGAPLVDFTIIGSDKSRDTGTLGAGLTVPLGENTIIYADFDTAFSAETQTNTVALGLRTSW
jgi:outer membrane autotransporter protein